MRRQPVQRLIEGSVGGGSFVHNRYSREQGSPYRHLHMKLNTDIFVLFSTEIIDEWAGGNA